MSNPSPGDTVKVHYTGTLDDGTVFDSSKDRDPLEFTLGQQQVIPGFEKVVADLTPGETKKTQIASEDAYGDRRDDLLVKVERDQLPDDLVPEVGQQLHMQTQNGQVTPVTVAEVQDEKVTLDANHPLAGKDLTFEIELLEVN